MAARLHARLMAEFPLLDKSGLRRFGLSFGAVVVMLFGLALPWLFDYETPRWPWFVGAAFLVWAVAAPGTLNWFYRAWMRFGLLLNAIMSPLLLGIVFYLIVLPTAFIIRLRGRDPLRRRTDPQADSYRVGSHAPPPERMDKPF